MTIRSVMVGMALCLGCGAPVAPPAAPSVDDSDPFERAARAIDRLQTQVDAWKSRGDAPAETTIEPVWEWARPEVRNRFLAMTPASAIDAHALGQLQSCVVDSMPRAHPDGSPAAQPPDDGETYAATAFAPWLFRRTSNLAPPSANELHPRVLVRDGQCFVVEPRLQVRTSARWASEQDIYAASEGVERSLFDAEKRLGELRRALGGRRGADRRIGELRHLVDRDEAVMARLRQRADDLEHALGSTQLIWIPLDTLVPTPEVAEAPAPTADSTLPAITGVSPTTMLLGSQTELSFVLTGTAFPDRDLRVYMLSGSGPVQVVKPERLSATQLALEITAPSPAALRALFPPEVAQTFLVTGATTVGKRVATATSRVTFTPHLPLQATSLCRVHAPGVDMQLRLHIPGVASGARVSLVQTDDASQASEVVACSNAQVFGADELVCFVPERTVLGPRTRIQVLRAAEHADPQTANESQLGDRWSSDAGVECTGLEPAR